MLANIPRTGIIGHWECVVNFLVDSQDWVGGWLATALIWDLYGSLAEKLQS